MVEVRVADGENVGRFPIFLDHGASRNFVVINRGDLDGRHAHCCANVLCGPGDRRGGWHPKSGHTDSGPPQHQPDSQLSYIVVESQIPANAMSELKAQCQNLIDLAGIAVAYVQNECTKKNNANLMWDADLWKLVFTKLPTGSAAKFEREQKKESVQGSEIAAQFVARLSGMIVARPELLPFTKFLGTIQESIRSGKSDRNEFGFGSIAITLSCQTAAGRSSIQGWLKGTFIKFLNTKQIVKSSCSTETRFDFDVVITSGLTLLDYGKLQSDGVTRKKFEEFLQGMQLTAIQKADSFFDMKRGVISEAF